MNIKAFIIGLLIGGVSALFLSSPQELGAQVSVFKSSQVGTSPQNGYILSTDGSNSTWIANTGGGGGGGSDTNWTWSSALNVIDSNGASTTATTSVRSNAFFATSTTIASNFRLLTATSATTTNFRTTQFGVGSDYITDLTGTGLSISGGALTVTNDHSPVTVSGVRDYITLSGQDIVRGVVDISDDTNLTADGTEIVLTGDALSLGTALTFLTGTSTTSFHSALGLFTNASSTYASSSRLSLYGPFYDRTSSAGTNGMVLQTNGSGVTWVATSTLGLGGAGGGTVTSVDMTVPTGLSISGNPVTTSGTLALTYGAGYEGFLTASGTNWNGFYNIPSSRITAGNHIDWTSNTLDVVTTGDWTGTLDGFEGATLAQTNWSYNGSRLSPSTTVGIGVFASSTIGGGTGATGLTISGGATTTGNHIITGSATSSTSFFSALGTFTNSVINTLLTAVNATITGVLTIPNGTGPTANDPGEIAHDTTGNQLIVDDHVVPLTDQRIWGVTVASTSPAFISGGLVAVPTLLDGYTITRIQCHVTSGTSKVIAVEDASANSSEDITCTTSNTTDDGSITNATYTASELSYIDFGSTSGSVDTVSISVFGNWTRE